MINKLYKRIHNKYSTLFKFIFFIRYLFGIFFISIILFLSIPHFFDLEKKDQVIKKHLFESYGFKLNSYKSIKYNSFPLPNLEINNADLSFERNSLFINVANFKIYPKLISIYNYEDFKINKVVINKNKISLSDAELKFFFNHIYNLSNKIKFKNLNLNINKKKKHLIDFKKINFSNYGYKKNIVTGKLFNKKFKISISDNYDKINFILYKTGITSEVNLNKVKKLNSISGIFKAKLLKSNLKFNFDYDKKKIKIYNSYFRNKDLSFRNKSTIVYNPFFNLSSNFKIENINFKLLKKININDILNSKDLIKKINTTNNIDFKSKKFSKNIIDDFNLNISLAYGRLTFSKKITIQENLINCRGNINLLQEYPILYFECSLNSKDKKKLLKEFSIKYKNKNEPLNVHVEGNINILSNKINFNKIDMNNNYKATKEDLDYFKKLFETILFDKDFIKIFNFNKIKEFILEIS
jgi:hypothetical protein